MYTTLYVCCYGFPTQEFFAKIVNFVVYVQSVRTALSMLSGGSIEDSKAVCDPDVLKQIFKWKVLNDLLFKFFSYIYDYFYCSKKRKASLQVYCSNDWHILM